MSRSRSDDYDRKRRRILDIAAGMFARVGFPTCTMSDIAVRCGVSKSNLYHYFVTKEDLLYDILSTYCEFILEQIDRIAASEESPDGRLASFVEFYLVRSPLLRAQHVVLLNDLKYLLPAQKKKIVGLERKMVESVANILREVSGGEPADDRTLRTYTMLLFGLLNGSDAWIKPTGFMSPAHLARRISDLFLRGFQHSARLTRIDE